MGAEDPVRGPFGRVSRLSSQVATLLQICRRLEARIAPGWCGSGLTASLVACCRPSTTKRLGTSCALLERRTTESPGRCPMRAVPSQVPAPNRRQPEVADRGRPAASEHLVVPCADHVRPDGPAVVRRARSACARRAIRSGLVLPVELDAVCLLRAGLAAQVHEDLVIDALVSAAWCPAPRRHPGAPGFSGDQPRQRS